MKKLLIPAAALALSCVLMAQIPSIATPQPGTKLRKAQEAIVRMYVDTVNEEQLTEAAIKGMLSSLDPHSSYSNAAETAELNEPLEGSFSGIGITYNLVKDTLYVISTVNGGPSQKAGILPGDRIIAVGDSLIAGVKIAKSKIQKLLRGPQGTTVDLTVMRGKETIPFRLVRAQIPIYSIDAAYMATPSTGYIALNKFAADTPDEFREALSKLKAQGMKNLILDLTDNGGGYMSAADGLLSELLPPEALTVYTQGDKSPRSNHYTDPLGARPMYGDGRLVVMVNQYSASASEITAGAVQDWDRGVIVGRRTFGKGLVQRPIPFSDGSMIRLTIAHYYTPSGRDIQKPYTRGDEESYRADIVTRFEGGELMHLDSVHLDSTKRFETLRLRRPVYGGGGIMPEAFVPLDTTENTKYYRNLSAKGVINQYVLSYLDAHRKALKKEYKTDDDFVRGFEVSDAMLSELRAMADVEKIEFNQEEWNRSLPLLRVMLKALIGRDMYENQTFDKVYNPHDPIFRRALELIESAEYDGLLSAPKTGGKR